MYSSESFAANAITKPLYEKLLGGGYLFPKVSVHVYVSSDGSDTTGDGSESKPFATFDQALLYVQEHVAPSTRAITIHFASDYTQVGTNFNHIVALTHAGSSTLTIDGYGHNVTLNTLQVHSNSCVLIKDINVTSTTYPINVNGVARFLGTVSVSGTSPIIVRNGGLVLFDAGASFEFTNTGTTACDVIHIVNNAVISSINTGTVDMSITLNGNIRYVFTLDGNAAFLRGNSCVITQTTGTTQTKYRINKNSYFDTNGRGVEWIPGGAGTVDETSTVQ